MENSMLVPNSLCWSIIDNHATVDRLTVTAPNLFVLVYLCHLQSVAGCDYTYWWWPVVETLPLMSHTRNSPCRFHWALTLTALRPMSTATLFLFAFCLGFFRVSAVRFRAPFFAMVTTRLVPSTPITILTALPPVLVPANGACFWGTATALIVAGRHTLRHGLHLALLLLCHVPH